MAIKEKQLFQTMFLLATFIVCVIEISNAQIQRFIVKVLEIFWAIKYSTVWSINVFFLLSLIYICLFLIRVSDDEWEMVEKKGNQFIIGDWPFYVNGFNTYWLMIFAVDPSTRAKVTDVFQQASSAGLTVCRTWAFNDGGWRALQKSPSSYDEQVFQVVEFS